MKNDAAFVADFRDSHRWVLRAARWLVGLGYKVQVPKPLLRPNATVRSSYSDGGDLLVTSRDRTTRVVEVKHRGIEFTSARDYPFATVIVNESYKVTRSMLEDVWGYVIFNRAGTHVAVVPADTETVWTTERHWDEAQQRTCEFSCCPLAFVRFYQIPRHLMPNA